MKYMLFIYQDETILDEDGRQHCYQETGALASELQARVSFWRRRRSSRLLPQPA